MVLSFLPPGDFERPRDKWLHVGMGLHHTDEGLLSDWVDWSNGMSNFDEEECLSKWESFGRGDGDGPAVTLGTLIHMAREYGYKPPAPRLRFWQGGTGERGAAATVLGEALERLDEGNDTLLDAGAWATLLHRGLGGALRFNDLSRLVEIDGTPIPEDEMNVFDVPAQQRGHKVSQKSCIDGFLYNAFVNRYHPVREYLEALESDGSIEPFELSTAATQLLGTSDPLMLRATLIGAVARALEPGCQFDAVCVLKGGQGIKKSTFWKTLASPAWFCSTIPEAEKDLLLNVHSCWIFELAELESVTGKREVGVLKNQITTSIDSIRVPYGKATERKDRRSIFVASVKGDSFLPDETGHRR
ncbi:MAG: VapE domain-containing protein [Prochlorococcaceae cyanobacterium]